MTRSSYAWAVGQWLQVNRTTRTLAWAKSLRRWVRPSTPGRAKSGAAAPISNVFTSGCAAGQAPASIHPATTPATTQAPLSLMVCTPSCRQQIGLRMDLRPAVGLQQAYPPALPTHRQGGRSVAPASGCRLRSPTPHGKGPLDRPELPTQRKNHTRFSARETLLQREAFLSRKQA